MYTKIVDVKPEATDPLEDLDTKMDIKDIVRSSGLDSSGSGEGVQNTALVNTARQGISTAACCLLVSQAHFSSILICQPIKTLRILIFRHIRKIVKSEY